MGRQPNLHRDAEQRLLLAQTAARLIAEGGLRDFAMAKRKAAAQLGVDPGRNLPDNAEIEAALRDYQRLFQQDRHPQQLRELRQTALQAMRLLSRFSPRLVGAVLNGTADRHTPVHLHLFADTSEEVNIFLMDHKIPFTQAERHVHYKGGREEYRPMLRFMAGEVVLELTLFPIGGLRQAPLSPVDGRPSHRASLEELQRVLDRGDPTT